MKISFNNTEIQVGRRVSLRDLMVSKGFSTHEIPVAVNNRIIPFEEWKSFFPSDNSRVELLYSEAKSSFRENSSSLSNNNPGALTFLVYLNRKPVELSKATTLSTFMMQQNLFAENTTVAINNRVILADDWDKTLLSASDRIDTIAKENNMIIDLSSPQISPDPKTDISEMEIYINNKKKQVPKQISLDLLLDAEAITKESIAVAINNLIIPRSDWQDKSLTEGDKIIIIRATCGG